MSERVACTACGALILLSTAEANSGLCAPCKGGYRKSIEDGKRQRAERKKAQANPDPATKHWKWLVKQVYRSPGGFAGLSAENQMFFAACLLEVEIYNGGFDQYFSNSSADYYIHAVRGLQEIGAMACCRIVLAAKQSFFGAHDVPDTQTSRWDHIRKMAPLREKELRQLDRSFTKEAATLRDLAAQYARKHRLYDGC
jgi:hypothetical protein